MIPKIYNAKEHEDAIYQQWESSGFFAPDNLPGKRTKPFTIAIPPPNVTGNLHIGHAMMLAIEDLMIRFERMRGKKTLWIPGLDHAAIATQNVVEKKIWKEEKKTRHDLGREEFLKRIATFVEESKGIIRTQMKKMGASCDWSRERYTMDDGLSEAVQTMFVHMYEDGLVYRGDRIVNWCTRCQSTLADDEVHYREEKVPFYYFKFGPFTIGTVRPETKVQDKVVIVHPDDKRYTKYHGKKQRIPWIDGTVEMRVIADTAADPEMGSGAMTITPAHSFVDFELAKKYGVPIFNIIGQDGKLTDAAGRFAGMEVRDARKKFVEILKEKGLVEKIDEEYVHNISLCYRCETPIEPLVSKQWFIAVDRTPKSGGKSLKQRALAVVRKGEVAIIPDRFTATYFHWMENLHDWCISRQIWFGHRIPVWYHEPKCIPKTGGDVRKCVETIVATEQPTCDFCDAVFVQDPDTLDTWFSAGLWTFSTLGWPKKTKDLTTFHPTSVLETGYDILFFWVARMIMMTTYALDEVPFETVYLHGLVRDKLGRKMSKSLGNGIDPLDVIAKYGADPVRLSLIIGSTPGNDVRLSDEKIAGFRNFVNKLWNIGRFVLAQNGNPKSQAPNSKQNSKLSLADRWILSRFQSVCERVTDDCDHFRFSQAGETLRQFTWNDFADWYVEIGKFQILNPKSKTTTVAILHSIFHDLLKLWHPYTPYVTEVLWKHFGEKEMLLIAPWPKKKKASRDLAAETAFERLRSLVQAIRNARAFYRIPVSTPLTAHLVTEQELTLLQEHIPLLMRLAHLESCTVEMERNRPENAITLTVGKVTIFLPVGGILDMKKEQERVKKEIEKKTAYVAALEQKLSHDEFLSKAPKEVIAAEKEKWDRAREELERLRDFLSV